MDDNGGVWAMLLRGTRVDVNIYEKLTLVHKLEVGTDSLVLQTYSPLAERPEPDCTHCVMGPPQAMVRRRRPSSPAPAAPLEDDDLLGEIDPQR